MRARAVHLVRGHALAVMGPVRLKLAAFSAVALSPVQFPFRTRHRQSAGQIETRRIRIETRRIRISTRTAHGRGRWGQGATEGH